MKFRKKNLNHPAVNVPVKTYRGETIGQRLRALREQGVTPDVSAQAGVYDDVGDDSVDPMGNPRVDPMDFGGLNGQRHIDQVDHPYNSLAEPAEPAPAPADPLPEE